MQEAIRQEVVMYSQIICQPTHPKPIQTAPGFIRIAIKISDVRLHESNGVRMEGEQSGPWL